tara:strand:- start:321 stop:587 length:267 start_codon:yes stop_codon:yes gene_type:complete
MDDELSLDDIAAIFAMGFFNYLSEKEGIVVHYQEHAYVIYHEDDEIKLNKDDEMLAAEHLQLVWLHDIDDPDDQIPPGAPQIDKSKMN